MNWCRLWHDFPTEPKWRSIAIRSGQSIPDVMAVYIFAMVNASSNDKDRGSLKNWDSEDVAASLGISHEVVAAIFVAMQGKVLEGDYLSGWDARQPKKEDPGCTDRVNEHRQRKRDETLRNAGKHAETTDKIRLDKKKEEITTTTSRDVPLDEFPETVATVQDLQPGTDEDLTRDLVVTAAAIKPSITDKQIAYGLRKTHKSDQKSARLWLTTFPQWLKTNPNLDLALIRGKPPGTESAFDIAKVKAFAAVKNGGAV